MKDYYELLEVNKKASEDTIKKVFRMLIKKNHPDLFEGEEKTKAEERVKELNEAYEILSDEAKRQKYDLELEEENIETDLTIETLIKENEYLKSVIQQKNEMIKEYLEEVGVDTRNFKDESFYEDEEEKDNTLDNNSFVQTEAYNLYKSKQRIKNIIYMAIMIFIGIILLSLTTGINIFGIFVDMFKMMF